MAKQITIILCLLLTGCASNVDSSWQCKNPVPKGSACVNISQADGQVKKKETNNTESKNPVNRDVTDNMIKAAADAREKAGKPKELLAADAPKKDISKAASDIGPQLPYMEEKYEIVLSQRTPETVSRIWFAPFIDKYNNRHEESIIYVIDQESSWRAQ